MLKEESNTTKSDTNSFFDFVERAFGLTNSYYNAKSDQEIRETRTEQQLLQNATPKQQAISTGLTVPFNTSTAIVAGVAILGTVVLMKVLNS